MRGRAVRQILDHEHEDPSPGGGGIGRGYDRLLGAETDEEGRKAEPECGKRPGLPSGVAEELKALERETSELPLANERIHKRSVYNIQAQLARRFKP